MNAYKLRNTILDLLLRIERDSGYSHLLIGQEIQLRKISKKDAALLTEVVYGTLDRKLTLDYYLHAFVKRTKKIELWVKLLLHMSIYQMKFLNHVPDHAIIYEAVEIAKQRGHKGIASFVNGILRNIRRQGFPDIQNIEDNIERLSIRTSHPRWLIERFIQNYGFETAKLMCEANLERKELSVRINALRITRESAIEQLESLGYRVRKSQFSDQGIVIEQGNILESNLFTEDLITIQDQSSMLVGELIDVKPGMMVLDTCSAPGGKVTHMAEKMANTGHIDAFDLHPKKINTLKEKADHLGISIIHANQADARLLHQKLEKEAYDRVVVDAPCSGFGVIRSKPDIKYNKNLEDIYRLSTIQLDILASAAPLVKKGGRLLYSTCTVEKVENEEVVEQFLQKHSDFRMDEKLYNRLPPFLRESLTELGLQLFPHVYQTDGFFLTVLRKI